MNSLSVSTRIAEMLARFRYLVELENRAGRFDVNVYAEDVVARLLNVVLDLDLINNNALNFNSKAVDLIDEANRIAVQVTSIKAYKKVKHTLELFMKENLYTKFDVLYMFVLTEKLGRYNQDVLDKLCGDYFRFDCRIHIIDHSNILRRIASMSIENARRLLYVLENEFSDQIDKFNVTTSNKYKEYLSKQDIRFLRKLTCEMDSIPLRLFNTG